MAECAFCGQPMRPGATSCPACGNAPASPAARGVKPIAASPTAPSVPNPRAGIAIAAMPIVLIASVFTFSLANAGGIVDVASLVIAGALGAVVCGLAWAVWTGATWARWLALVATIGWAVFMLWTIPSQIRQLRDPMLMSYGQARGSIIFGLIMSCAELGIAAAALYFLLFPRARIAR